MLYKTVFLVQQGVSLFPWSYIPLCIYLRCMLILIVFILNIVTYCVPLLCAELCECRRYPWPAYTYLLFTSCFPKLDPSYVSTSWVCRNFCKVVSLVFPYFGDLRLLHWTSSIQVYSSSFSLISYPHVISGIIIFWTNILLFLFW